jgi:hypothetical protein
LAGGAGSGVQPAIDRAPCRALALSVDVGEPAPQLDRGGQAPYAGSLFRSAATLRTVTSLGRQCRSGGTRPVGTRERTFRMFRSPVAGKRISFG